MYIVLKNGQPATWEKFPDLYSAKVWCIHHKLAWYKTVNGLGDCVIVLNAGVFIEKLR